MNLPHKESSLGLSSTPEEIAAAAKDMGIPENDLKKMLLFLEKLTVEAERLHLHPSVACNAALTFISNAIKFHYSENGWQAIHYDCATGLMQYVNTEIAIVQPDDAEVADPPEKVH